MFDFQYWIDYFKEYYRDNSVIYNDAESYGVIIQSAANLDWKVLGVHHLTPDENKGNHNVYIEVLCKQNEREGFRAIHWTWEGRQPNESAPDVFAGQKPLNELVNIPINVGMVVSVWPHLGETVLNLRSDHPDEETGNTFGHHSFFVCFQEVDADGGQLPEPDPEPANATIEISANIDWLNTLPIDSQGNITFTITGNSDE
jgi:hypothetical protein